MNSRLMAVVLLLAVPTIAFWPVFNLHERSFFVYPDNVRQVYPWFQKFASSIHNGYLPLWDSNVNSGNSFVGEIQTGVFYLPNLVVMLLFGSERGISVGALDALVIFHFALASFGTYLFCRELGLSRGPAAFAGILFSYTGPHANRAMAQIPIFFTYSLLPLAAYLVLKYTTTRRLVFALGSGGIVGAEMLAGHFAAPFLSLLICAAIVVGSSTSGKAKRDVFAMIALLATTLVIASPQLFFGLQHFLTSYRGVGTAQPLLATSHIPISAIEALALAPSGLLSFFDPIHFSGGEDGNVIFLGFVPIVAIWLGLTNETVRVTLTRSLRNLWALYALAALSLVVAVGTATPIGRVWFSLPFFSTIVRESGRYVLIFQFVVSIVCALVIHALSEDANWNCLRVSSSALRRLMTLAIWVGLIAYLVYIVRVMPSLQFGVTTVLFASLAFAIRKARLAAIVLIVLGIFEDGSNASLLPQSVSSPTYAPYVYRDSSIYRLPESCYPVCRIAASGMEDDVPANVGDVLKLQSRDGYTALIDRDYLDLESVDWSDTSFVNDVLNVRYIITKHQIPGLKLVSRDNARGLNLYERASVFPRVFSLNAALKRNIKLNDVVFSVVKYDDRIQTFQVRVDRPEVVVFSEQYYPGWSVTVDGRRATLFVAGIRLGPAVLRAVRLKAGSHEVEFRYLAF